MAILSIAMLSACGANDGANYTQETCDRLISDANMWAELAYEADQSGDSESYEYYKDAFYNFSQSYDENCSDFR